MASVTFFKSVVEERNGTVLVTDDQEMGSEHFTSEPPAKARAYQVLGQHGRIVREIPMDGGTVIETNGPWWAIVTH